MMWVALVAAAVGALLALLLDRGGSPNVPGAR
jgi:hypothetical protein